MNDGIADLEYDPEGRQPLPYRRVAGLRLARSEGSAKEPEYLLKPPGGQLLVLGEQERLLWDSLDGATSFEEIERRFRARFSLGLRYSEFLKFVAELVEAGALERVPDSPAAETGEPAPRIRRVALDEAGAASTAASPGAIGGGANAARAAAGSTATADNKSRMRRARGGAKWGGGRKTQGFRAGMKDLWSVKLGNPDRFYSRCAAIFWPIHLVSWGLVPLVLVAFLISFKDSTQWLQDWSTMIRAIPQWPALWVAEHLTTWTGKVIEGTVIYGFGGKVHRVDIKLFMGLFVRCHLEETTVKSLTRRQKLWIAASTLLWRLFCWAICMVIWAMAHPTRPIIAQIALFEAFMGIASFVICACPLIPLYGYKFLEVLLDQDGLYGRSLRLVMLKLKGRRVPADLMTISERWGLTFMAVGTTLFFSIYVLHILWSADVWTVNNMAGLGAWLASIHMGACVLYFYLLWRFSARLRIMHRAERARAQGAEPVGI